MKRAIVALLLFLSVPVAAAAQSTIFVVRHAERADGGATGMKSSDPELSSAGRARAESLAAALKDTRLTAIFATEFKRTRQTAEPLAKALGIPVTTVRATDVDGLVRAVKAATGNVLVVGHSNTVPDVLQKLGVAEPVTIGDSDYDNLFVVVNGEKPFLVRLHFR